MTKKINDKKKRLMRTVSPFYVSLETDRVMVDELEAIANTPLSAQINILIA
jgi:hypothetical protein